MIFQNSNKKSAQDDPAVAMPAAQPVAEESAQDDQELARVLADIDNQVNTNNDNLMADLENATALENSQPAEPAETTETTETTETVDATEPMVDLAPAFERIDQEADIETSPLTDSQPTASPEVSTYSQSTEPSLDQQLATMSQQISNNMAELASNQDQPAETTDSAETTDAEADLPIETTASDTSSEPLSAPALVSDLDELRKKALSDLRPIVDKVELNDEESFYILLLLIRETDDESLLPKAYEAARQIRDEARRAQALLDVIKEADYFKHKA